MHVSLWNAFVIGFAIAAAVYDLRWRKIPRSFNLVGFVAGLLFHTIYGRLLDALQCALVAFTIGMILYSMGAIGGGDVKLMAALGSIVGAMNWFLFFLASSILGAVAAIAMTLAYGRFYSTLWNVGQIVKELTLFRAPYKRQPQLDLHHANITFCLIVIKRHIKIIHKSQYR